MFLVGVNPLAVTLEGDLFEATPTIAASKTGVLNMLYVLLVKTSYAQPQHLWALRL